MSSKKIYGVLIVKFPLDLYIDGSLYFHTALPFGLRSATMICQRTTKSVAYILNTEGISVDVYIDDFYGAESSDSSELLSADELVICRIGFNGHP